MYTDGVTETIGDNGKEFGEAWLLETLRNSRNLEAARILRNIEDEPEQFRSGEQGDDLTLVIARALAFWSPSAGRGGGGKLGLLSPPLYSLIGGIAGIALPVFPDQGNCH